MSIRGAVRVTGAAKNTITNLLLDMGRAAAEYQDGALVNLSTRRIECDEIWSFCHSKQKNVSPEHEGQFGYGDVWTWTAIDADSKLVPLLARGRAHGRGCLPVHLRPQVPAQAPGADDHGRPPALPHHRGAAVRL